MSSPTLLAVDLGLRAGLALYNSEGRVVWYRSTNFGSTARLKKAIPSVMRSAGPPEFLVVEGGGRLLTPWQREADRVGSRVIEAAAEHWRNELLLQRDRRTGADAKQNAIRQATAVIAWSGAPSPTGTLRDDTAEAILVGLWAARRVGWIEEYPLI
jgi:hypothetical protein